MDCFISFLIVSVHWLHWHLEDGDEMEMHKAKVYLIGHFISPV